MSGGNCPGGSNVITSVLRGGRQQPSRSNEGQAQKPGLEEREDARRRTSLKMDEGDADPRNGVRLDQQKKARRHFPLKFLEEASPAGWFPDF